ncbi:MAG: hypothetical protein ACO22K_04610 [Woeseiaceae bacterium]
MERLLQILDDCDDLIGSVGLVGERVRKGLLLLTIVSASLTVQVGGVLLAFRHPPLALAFALLLFVALLYREVTSAHKVLATTSFDGKPDTP